jgi:regulator of protease activity HflC (stomatin/prohibitin superfamily)
MFVYALYVFGLLAVILFFFSIKVVEQQTRSIVERWGKFHRILNPGFNIIIPIMDRIKITRVLWVKNTKISSSSFTKDQVTVTMYFDIKYKIIENKIYDASYKLGDVINFINTVGDDAARGKVPEMDMESVISQKDLISDHVKDKLSENLNQYGYIVENVSLTNLELDPDVVASKNRLSAAVRNKEAALHEAEEKKILKIKLAEGDAASSKLQGEGLASQRTAIVEGLNSDIEKLKNAIGESIDSKEVLETILITQFFDTVEKIGSKEGNRVIFMPYTPGGLKDIATEIRNGVIQANSAQS